MASEHFHPNMEWVKPPEVVSANDVICFPPLEVIQGSISCQEKMFIAQLMMANPPKIVVETGTFRGMTTNFIKDVIKTNSLADAKVFTFDWPDVQKHLIANSPELASSPFVELVPGRLPESLIGFLSRLGERVDFAVVDADHTYRSVKAELESLSPYMREGSYIFCHDYKKDDEIYFGTIWAIDEFSARYGYDKLALTPTDQIWGSALLRKRPKRRPAYRAWKRKLPFHKLRWAIKSLAWRS